MSTRTRVRVVTIVTMAVLLVVVLGLTATSAAAAQRNPDCLLCHEATQQFASTAVDRDAVCGACHTPGLLGTHPYHQAGANCGAYCHPGWGEALFSATPNYLTSAGSFASPDSPNTDSATLHVIHAQARWPEGVSTSVSECASCHSPAACDACHTAPLSPVHEAHGSSTYPNHTRQVGYGIVGEDQMTYSVATEDAQCGSSECHDVVALENGDPLIKEDFSHAAYPEYGYPEANTVVTSGTWRAKRSTSYTGGQMSHSNQSGATLSLSFTGNRIAFISDLDPYRGQGEVWIDGALAGTFDGYSATTKYQSILWKSAMLADGPHDVEIRVLGTKQASARGTWVSVDAFRVWAPMRELIAPDCDSSCHSDKSEGHGGSFTHEASQTAGFYPAGRFECTECHSLSMWTEHERTSSKSQVDGCAACHTTYADYSLDEYVNNARAGWGSCTWAGDGSTTGCHDVANGQDPHNYNDTDHDASGIPATQDCRDCHGDDLSVIHDDTNASRGQHASLAGNAHATDCLTCHGTDPTFPTTKDCTDSGCHVTSGVVSMATHPAPAHNGTNNNAGVDRTGGHTCSTCHQLELTSEHGKSTSVTDPGAAAIGCTDCHNAGYFPNDWLDTAGTTNTCNACHDPAGAADAGLPHEAADYSAKHNWDLPAANASSCSGSYCHDGDTAWLGDINAADVLHDASKPGAGDCTSCHDDNTAVPGETLCSDCHGSHVAVGAAHGAFAGSYPANADCLACHPSYGSAAFSHAGGSCAGCHENTVLTAAGTRYLGGTYDLTCTGCHNSTVLGTYNYQPYDPNHYDPYLANHTVNYGADSVPTGGSVVTSKPCTACHANSLKAEHALTLSAGSVGCIDCHLMSAPIDAAGEVAADWTNDKCGDCHGANHGGTGQAAHDMSGSATSLGCSAGGCHDANTDDIAALHGDISVGLYTSCNVCHPSADTDLSAVSGCDTCHTGHDMTVHEVTADSGDCLRCHGNDGAPADDVRGIHANCDQCHNNGSYPGITTGKTSDCVDCHNAALVAEPDADPDGSYVPYDPNHYNGTEAIHTADNAGDTGFSNTDGHACVSCHNQEMKPEHFKTSSAFSTVPGTYAEKCSACHEADVDSLGTWNDDCVACHTTGSTHTGFNTQHDAAAAWDTSCGGGGCHDTDNVDLIHKDSVGGNATVTTCLNTCHTTNVTVPASIACDTSGCHSGAGHGHELDEAASVGCYDSGAGCHSSSSTDYASTDYHPANGCSSGNCHAASNRGNAAYDNPNSCQTCHDGSYDGASDTDPLLEAGPTGHYAAANHDIGLFQGVVKGTSGGSATARCNDCHSRDDTGDGLIGLHTQHQGLQDKGDVTCAECHNNFSVVVAADWPTPSCGDCHNGGTMSDPGDTLWGHLGAVGPVVNAIEAAGAGSCQTSGCHTTLNLHELHDGDAGSSFTGCDLSGCHDYAKQGWKPTQTSCGTGGDCHTTDAHDPNAHDATGMDTGGCVDCHESYDIKVVHGNNCSTCHNTGDNLGGVGNTADCVDCHDGDTANGDVYYNASDDPDYQDHYDAYMAEHQEDDDISTKDWGTTDYGVTLDYFYTGGNPAKTTGNTYEVPCADCHTNDMMTEHSKTTVGFSTVPGTHPDVCVACHELKVDNFASAWTGGCGGESCHSMASGADGLHRTSGSGWDEKHDASNWSLTTPSSDYRTIIGGTSGEAAPSGGTTAASCQNNPTGDECHDVTDVADIHANIGAGGVGAGFADGFESGDFSSWTSAEVGGGGSTTVFSDTFESGNLNAWTSNSAQWGATNSSANNGSWSALGSPTVDNNYVDMYLTKTIDLSGLTGDATLDYAIRWINTETEDSFVVEYFNGSWTAIDPGYDLGPDQGWMTDSVTIPQAATQFRFKFNANYGTDDVFIDDVTLSGPVAGNGGWTVQTGTKTAGTYGVRAEGTGPQWWYLTKTGINTNGADSVRVSYDISWNGLENTDDVIVQYTTNGGGAWQTIKDYDPAGADPATLGWTGESFSGLPVGIDGVRFGLYANATGDEIFVDAVSVTPVTAGGSSDGCDICHTGNTQHPTIQNCQDAACHPGVNLDEHDNHHDTNFTEALGSGTFDSAFSEDWCEACHFGGSIGGIDDEHEVLSTYDNANTPCSMCHKKTTDTSPGGASVAQADTIAAIDAAGTDALCSDCHSTFTKERPHVQRGTVVDSDAGNTGIQFTAANQFTGHMVYGSSTRNPWFENSWEGYTLTGVVAGDILVSPWGANSLVTCDDCHLTAATATNPHAGTMQVNVDGTWNNSVSLGGSGTGFDQSGTLCAKCHDLYQGGWSNLPHDKHAGRSGDDDCAYCHSQVPHQSTHIRMIGLESEGAVSGTKANGLTDIRPHNITSPGSESAWAQSNDCGDGGCYGGEHTYSGPDW